MDSISRAGRAGAMALALLAGCAAQPPAGTSAAPAPALPKPLAPRPLRDVFILEAAGATPEDTTVNVLPRGRRVVVLRRSAPDFGLFARLEFGDSAIVATNGNGGLRLTLHPEPGVYGLLVSIEGTIREGASIEFSYGAHFVAPAGARERYQSDLAFERQLAIGRIENDERVVFLPTHRPGTDMLSAPLPGPGRYVVAAPR